MRVEAGRFTVRLAENEDDVAAAQRLRFRVFVEEMGAHVSDEDRALRRERDRFDPYYDHLLLIDNEATGDPDTRGVVGAYRLMLGSAAKRGIGYYGAQEYDLHLLDDQRQEVLELGRSCVDREHRGGAGMHLLWTALGQYVAEHDVGILFGVASFHGDDPAPLSQALSYLHHFHLAPPDLRVKALPHSFAPMDLLPKDQVDRIEALRQTPALIKAYMRLGGFVGEGAFVDHEFNTVDVCLLMDTTRMVQRYRSFYSRDKKEAVDRILG